jgi:hypothetical protein
MHDYHATLQPASPSFPSSSPQTSIEKEKKKQGSKPEIKPETPSKSVPNYTKTMHAFTLNQLNYIHKIGCSHNQTNPKPTNNTTSTAKRSTSTPNPFLPITSPLALKLPPSQSRTQYLSRSLSVLNQMSLDEEPCGPSNTPEPGEGHSPPPLPSMLASRSVLKAVAPDEDVDLNGDGDSETATSPMFSMSPTEMLAQGREFEARFEALVTSRSGAGANGDEGSRSSRGGGLEVVSSEARDTARFRMGL